ncbi:MAG: PfkB family carbohydrate kinase [Limnochordia bacterium]
MTTKYDIVLLGHYTKDTIISAAGKRVVDGGAFNYGANAAARMGLKTAAVTRLAEEDSGFLDGLRDLGVDVYATYTPSSTCLTLEYPSADPDDRVLYVSSTAGPFTLGEVEGLSAEAMLIGASIRGEVPKEVIAAAKSRVKLLALDVQGFIRVEDGGRLVYAPWPEQGEILSMVDVLKTDAVEAEFITGEKDMFRAAKILAGFGPREVVLTHRSGIVLYTDGTYLEAQFKPSKLIGRSGRGDTCIASYVSKRLSASPGEALVWSAALTSLKLEAEGPFKRPIEEVEELIRREYS